MWFLEPLPWGFALVALVPISCFLAVVFKEGAFASFLASATIHIIAIALGSFIPQTNTRLALGVVAVLQGVSKVAVLRLPTSEFQSSGFAVGLAAGSVRMVAMCSTLMPKDGAALFLRSSAIPLMMPIGAASLLLLESDVLLSIKLSKRPLDLQALVLAILWQAVALLVVNAILTLLDPWLSILVLWTSIFLLSTKMRLLLSKHLFDT